MFSQFQCAVGLVSLRLFNSHSPVCLGGHSGAITCARGVDMFVRVRSLHPRALCLSSSSLVFGRSIPVRLLSSGIFGPFPCSQGFVGFVPVRSSVLVRPGGLFRPFSCALEVVAVRSVLSHAPLGSSGAFGPFQRSLGVLGFIRVSSVHSHAPLRVVVFVLVSSVKSRAPFELSGSFGYFQSIPMRLGVRRVGSGVHGPFASALVAFGFVRVRLSPFWCALEVVAMR